MGDSRCTTLTCPEMKASITCAQLRSAWASRLDAGLVEQAVVVRHQQRRGVGDRQIADAHRRVGLGLGARIEGGQQRRRPPALSSAVSFNQSRRDMCSRHIPRLLVSCSDEGSNRYRRFGRRVRPAARRAGGTGFPGAARPFRAAGRRAAAQVHGPFAQHAAGAPPSSTMRSASSSASSISWVISSAAAPTSATTLRSSVCISARVTSSSAPNGSSSSSTAGWRRQRQRGALRHAAGQLGRPQLAGVRQADFLDGQVHAPRARAHPAPADA